ncbi:MAG: (d)CMP kinase [Ruminococcaceae bacterium]|nr:(d)CMP kinase [Oscillospiraceae bacterium]
MSFQIALDGPSGAGKSTVAKALAAKMNLIYVDTGALYRAIGLYTQRKGVDPRNAVGVENLLPEISLELRYDADGTQQVYLNGEATGNQIRTPEISMYASAVSAIPAVRAFLLDTQRRIAEKNDVVMDGRDIGTVILPNANVKIFLTANDECRAKRRWLELKEKGMEPSYESVLEDMRRRDHNDSTRTIAPAVAAPDAVLLDSSDLTIDECVAKIETIALSKRKK